jgi:hypothetical protein
LIQGNFAISSRFSTLNFQIPGASKRRRSA